MSAISHKSESNSKSFPITKLEAQKQKSIMENQLKLNKEQLQTLINEHILAEKGINEVFSMLLNGLMLLKGKPF